MLAEKATDLFLYSLECIEYGQFDVELPNGKSYQFAGVKPGPKAHLQLREQDVIPNMALKGDIAFADDYRQGKWESKDIASLVECALRNNQYLQKYIRGSRAQQFISKLSYLLTPNTKKGSRQNIYAHYDLGNSFYELWLDPTMTYSSALFKGQGNDLTTAQYNKYDRILDFVNGSSQNVLEIGCGWGGFAERCVEKSDHQIKSVTVSPSQCEYACRRLYDSREQVNVQLQDYRDIHGKYDAIVSIEMFEAVGERYWRTYFNKIKSLLNNKGSAIIQTITVDDKYFDEYRRGGDAIRSYIFPGGMLPSPERFRQEAERAGLKITDQYFFGHDYARTLQHWLNSFEAQADIIQSQNFDEPFMRLWRFYLASCIGAFSAERTNVMQVELRHA